MTHSDSSLQQRIREAVAAITGHQPSDLDADLFLESDLGIDSIKMVELSQSLVALVPQARRAEFLQQVPTERLMHAQTLGELNAIFAPWDESAAATSSAAATAAPMPAPMAATASHRVAEPAAAYLAQPTASSGSTGEVARFPQPAPASAPSVAVEADLAPRLFALISAITGHQPEDLDADLFLESDLGIDSIKMVELSQNLVGLVASDRRDSFLAQVPTERLMHAQTLGDLIGLLAPWQAAPATAAGGAPRGAGAGEGMHTPAAFAPPSGAPAAAADDFEPLDLLPSQYPFLVSHWAVSTCSLCSRVRLHGAFHAALAQAAWGDLLARHPALRARFVIPDDAATFKAYRYEIAAHVPAPPLAMIDLGHLPPEVQDTALAAELARRVNHQWSLREPLLHEFFGFRLADEVHEVFFTNHHLVSDGLSNQQIVREFLALYGARATGVPAALPPATSLQAYRQVVADLNAWSDPGEDKALGELLRRQGKQSFVWNPNQSARAADRALVRNYRFRLDPATTGALLGLTGQLRLPMNTLLVGAFLRTVAGFVQGQQPVFLNIPTSGRVYPGVDASHLVGCFAQNLALDFAMPQAGEDWTALLARVHREIELAIAGGCDRAQTRQVASMVRDRLQLQNGRIPESHTGMIRAGMKSNLFLPYIGNTHIAERYGPLAVLDYQAATVTNAGTLDTVIELFHGRLEMTTNYDANHYDEAFVAQVAQAYLAQLAALAGTLPAAQAGAARMGAAVTLPHAPSLQADQVRLVAQEIMHRAIGATEMGLDLEADLGLDSLERIRIVSWLERFVGAVDRKALLGCRSLAEMVAQLDGGASATGSLVSASMASGSLALASTAPVGTSHDDADLAAMPYRQIIAQCARTPEAVAVLHDGVALSYAQLHAQSNQLAHWLRSKGVVRGSLVGVMLPRGVHLMVALLGLLKAGGAYVPLDPDYPAERLRYMLRHAGVAIVLTEASVQAALAGCLEPSLPLRELVFLDGPHADGSIRLPCSGRAQWSAQPASDPTPVGTADDPMVVLYTSGSTGTPKGVVLAHRGYGNRHAWHQQLFQLQPGERVAQKTSICFDISVWELFWPLQVGGTVCPVATSVLRDPWALAQWIQSTGVRVMHFVPSLFGEFLNAVEDQTIAFPSLRQLVFSGEALPIGHVRRWFARFGLGAAMANLYGPTEASIDVTAWQMTRMPPLEMARVPIGHAMPNVQLLVLDEAMQPVAPGTQGELWIAGVQLAQGYLHDPQRTAESFHRNPFPDVAGATIYRTGDLVVQLADGSYDYRGRADSQVKIRGYRVELGEVEVALAAHPDVREAAVLALDAGDGHLRLSAWLAGTQVEARSLREFLGQRLPAYMVPQRFQWLPSLPRNQNGKLDRKVLAAQAEAERSLHAAHIDGRATVPAALPMPAVALDPLPDEQLVSNGLDYPMGPAQHWLLNYFDAPHLWAGYSRFRYLQPLDIDAFNRALGLLTARHAALRSVFQRRNGVWLQHFPQPRTVPQAEYYDGTQVPAAERDEQLRALIVERVKALRLDGNALLWSVIVIKEAEDRFDICVIGHHIISDMLGNGVLFKDLWRLYGDCLVGNTPDERASASFVSYLETLQKARSRESLAQLVNYWTGQFPAAEPAFSVPFDHRTGDNLESTSASEKFALGAADTAALQQARQQLGCNLYTVLLAPLYRTLGEWSGTRRVVLSHRVHGRDLGDGHTWFESVGNYAVNYPLALQVDPHADWAELARDVRQGFDSVPLNGVSYDLVADRLPAHLYPDHKLTPVRANYLGHRDMPRSRVFEFSAADWDQRFALPGQKRSALIEVFFVGGEGGMQVELSYSTHFHRAETIRRVGERYMALLRDLLQGSRDSAALPAPRASVVAAPLPSQVTPSQALSSPTPTTGALPASASASEYSTAAAPAAMAMAMHNPALGLQSAPAAPVLSGPLAGKVAIVTGAGRGIGRDIAARLAGQGAQVALVSRSAGSLEEALREVRAVSAGHVAITADVTVQADVERMVQQVIAQFGGIDILVNNAGANRSMLLTESDPKDWREIVDVNLMSAYLCCRSVVPQLIARGGGKVVNLGSVAGVIGYPLFSAYSASKHAVIGLTKALAEEVKHQNVQVNVICPALVDTRMTPQAFRAIAMPTEQVADVVLFLASPAANGITGESINIFGKQDMYAFGSDKVGVVKSMTASFRPGVPA